MIYLQYSPKPIPWVDRLPYFVNSVGIIPLSIPWLESSTIIIAYRLIFYLSPVRLFVYGFELFVVIDDIKYYCTKIILSHIVCLFWVVRYYL